VLFGVFAGERLVTGYPAQEGGIKGSVKDATGRHVSNATVTLNRGVGIVFPPAKTSANGQYEIRSLLPATYVACAEAAGYQESRQEGIVVTADEMTAVDFTLTPAAAFPVKAGPVTAGSRGSGCQQGFFDDSEMKAAGFGGSVDPSGYSASAEAQTRSSLMEGATELRKEANSAARGQSAPADGHQSEGDDDMGLEQHQRTFQADPSEQHRYDLGIERLLHGDIASALELFKEGVANNPRSAKLRIGLGIALYSGGHAEDAVRAFLSATDLNPADPRPYLFLGKAYGISNDLSAEVNSRLNRWIQLEPRNSRAYYYYALSLWKGKGKVGWDHDTGKIESLLKESALLDPTFPFAHFQLGNLYSEANRLPEAIAEYQRAVTLKSDWADTHYRLGQAYIRAGDKELGQQQLALYERLRGQPPANADLDEERQFVESIKGGENTKTPPQ
jgi:Flp pilus assembly protein TadD